MLAPGVCQLVWPAPMARRKASDVRIGKLRAADPFELIRWLARSQTDPRKALAELVQNSLDAGARALTITRVRERGVAALRIVDDGEGVIPDVARPEALAHIATHIGHSRKRNLTPQQRRELMLQGQYGIGLLGFWAIGAELEMRSQVAGGDPWVLRMWEERPSFEVAPLRGRLALERGTWTELVVRRLHRPALVSLTGRRISEYLASELRGQLLARQVDITIHDRMARGTAQKVRRVEPVRFQGTPLALPDALRVAGHEAIRAELYLVPEGVEPRVAIACGGTVVYDDLADALDGRFRREPWTAGRLTGLLEFPGFAVAPGSRRGVLLDEAAEAFAATVERELEPAVRAAIASAEERRVEAVEADMMVKLQRAFRDLRRDAPEYDFFAVQAPAARVMPGRADSGGDAAAGDGAGGAGAGAGSAGGAGVALGGLSDAAHASADDDAPVAPVDDAADEDDDERSLLPPGPLHAVEIKPARLRVERQGRRALRAVARDANGVVVRDDVTWQWTVCDGPVTLEGDTTGPRALLVALDLAGEARVAVTARQADRSASAETVVRVVEDLGGASGRAAGIPEPQFVEEPHGEWRSRFADERWQVNKAHRDFLAVAGQPRRKLRYLAALLAKEVVVHSFPVPQGGVLLERLVSVLTLTEPRLERG